VSKVWLERVARNIEYQDGNHGELHPKSEDYVSDGIPFIMANHIVAGQVDFTICNYIEPELAATLRIGFARTDDVLLTHKGTIGRVGVVQENRFPYVVLTPQVTYYRCLRRIAPRYLFWFFQSRYWQDQMHLVSSLGTTRGYVGLLDQRFLKLLLPTLTEQGAIAAYLDAETTKLDALIARVETAVDQLREYRIALISAAVAGKIDVRGETT
jgi:type I restriction enzyme S subunit